MGELRPVEFRVENFRNINDSGWIPLERVTAFVGRNESGKTALLKALHKFNPATEEPYDPQKEFPRDRFTRDYRSDQFWPVCSVKFEISDVLRRRIETEAGLESAPTFITYTRGYDGSLQYELEPDVDDADVPSEDVVEALRSFASGVRRLATPEGVEEETATTTRGELAQWANTWESTIGAIPNLKTATGIARLAELQPEANSKSQPWTADLIEALISVVSDSLVFARRQPTSERVEGICTEHLPVFIYFENYGMLDSAVYLPRLLEDIRRTPYDAKVRTVNAMFKHVNLTADEINELGVDRVLEAQTAGNTVTDEMIVEDQRKRELREVKLNSASLDITQRFSSWWKQRRHQIRYQADGPYFRIWVSDDRRPGVEIELESRSKGFQWFFSFYLVFLVESEEGHKNAILLLDEPGLNLHPTAQQELIGFFEQVSEDNILLYTTHSPFLIDGERIHRVRPVTETDEGLSRVSIGEWPDDRETIFPLQAAAGYEMMKHLFLNRKNVLVEGLSDYLYIHSFSLLLRALGKQGLPDDVYVTPCGGTRMVSQIAALFLGEQVRPLIVLDSDEQGIVRRQSLLRELYVGRERSILMLSEILGVGQGEIEDVVGEELLLPALRGLLGRALRITAPDRVDSATLPDVIAAAASRLGVNLPEGWRPEVARRLVIAWATVDPLTLPPAFIERIERLIADINMRVDEMHPTA